MPKRIPGADNVIRRMLQSLPIDKRAEAIVEIFRIIAAEFAAMVLEHVEVKPRSRRVPRETKAKVVDLAKVRRQLGKSARQKGSRPKAPPPQGAA